MNLLVVVADTFRADYLGCDGNAWIQTPNLDQMAAEGIRFNDFYAEALPTLPVRRVFYTGRRCFPFRYYPQKSDMVQLPGWHPLFDEDVTLAEWLRELGYCTGLISDVYHQFKPGKNFHRGFHSWQWIRGQEQDALVPTPDPDVDLSGYAEDRYEENDPRRRMAAQYLNNRAWWSEEADHYGAQVLGAASDWLEQYGHKRPWMLWVESFDPHEPWDAPKELADAYLPGYEGPEVIFAQPFAAKHTPEEVARIKAHYAGECTLIDRWMGRLLGTLRQQNLLDDTIVVFTSDHGCMMGEQGEIHKGADRVRIQVSRCPLIIRHPDPQYAGRVVDGFVQHQDLMPTLLKLAGEAVPERCNGEDFWPLVTGERTGGLRDYAVSAFGWYACVRNARWAYHTPWIKLENPRPAELYDREADPDELVNLIGEHPEVARELDEVLRAYIGDFEVGGTVGTGETPAAIPGLKW